MVSVHILSYEHAILVIMHHILSKELFLLTNYEFKLSKIFLNRLWTRICFPSTLNAEISMLVFETVQQCLNYGDEIFGTFLA